MLDQIPTVNWTAAEPTRTTRSAIRTVAGSSQIPITVPFLGPEEEKSIASVVRSGWVSQGPRVAEFERVVADYCGVRKPSPCRIARPRCISRSCLWESDLATKSICPSMSFIATANSIRHAGATPVFADVDARTYNLDPEAAESAVTPRTKAILVCPPNGFARGSRPFPSLAAGHGLKILEDAACAIGKPLSRPAHRRALRIGRFSFHPRKPISTGEGGMITTNNPAYARQLRLLRQHGMSVPDTVRHSAKQVILEEYVCLGYNFRSPTSRRPSASSR